MLKTVAGTMGGVFVPIVIEYAVQGADVSPSFPYKWSGVAGVAIGAVDLVLVYTMPKLKYATADNKYALVAFGAASLATGISILLLEQLRKSTAYTFQPPLGWQAPAVPMVNPMATRMAEQYTAPVGQVIKEI